MGEARQVSVTIPADATPGETELAINIGSGELTVVMPKGARPGDRMVFTLDQGSSQWKVRVVRAAPSQPAARADKEDAFERLVRAVRLAGAVVSGKLGRATVPSLGIHGILARESIHAGEEIIRLPAAVFISERAVQEKAPKLCSQIGSLLDRLQRPGLVDEAKTAAFLSRLLCDAFARVEDDTDVRLDGSAASVWHSWGDLLLEEDFSSHPYWRAIHDHDRAREVLSPSPEWEHAAAMAKEVLQTCGVLSQALSREMLGSRFGPGIYMQARLCVLTRAFHVGKQWTMLPLVDSFNHSADPGVSWHFSAEADVMVMIAERAHAPGEHMCISYGFKPNPLLFRTYGFTVPPRSEPSWAFVLQGEKACRVREIVQSFLPDSLWGLCIHLDTASIKPSLVEALNAAQGLGHDARDFLHELCSRCREVYESDPSMQAAFAALRRAREAEPSSAAWGDGVTTEELDARGPERTWKEDALRVKMSEYLALTAHMEITACAAGRLAEAQCLAGAAVARSILQDAFFQLGEHGRFILHTSEA